MYFTALDITTNFLSIGVAVPQDDLLMPWDGGEAPILGS